jgi:hypothetical protein
MTFCLIGALTALLFFSRIHDRALLRTKEVQPLRGA